MKETKFNFATVIALIVLMVFAYFTFMGLVYLMSGSVALSAVLAVLLIVVVTAGVQLMCAAKSSRWKNIGMVGQVGAGAVVLVVLLAAALPLTSFINVVGAQKELQTNVARTLDTARDLDSAYVRYVDTRIENYRQRLGIIARGQTINPTEYQQTLGGATGDTNEKKIENLCNSLRSLLIPDSIAQLMASRRAWIDEARNVVVWNPLTAANLASVDKQVSGWADNYSRISALTYKGEETAPFSYQQFDSQLDAITATYDHLQAPSILALLASLLCFAVMLLPYFVAQKSLARSVESEGNLYA